MIEAYEREWDEAEKREAALAKIAEGFELILQGLGVDKKDPHVQETPERAARAWYDELCRGLTGGRPMVTVFNRTEQDGMVVLSDIPVKSLCAHHLLPFVGTATVGYLPGSPGMVVGVSKLSRVTNYFARRPQVQERLTAQVADYLYSLVEEEHGGAGVVIKATHMCMKLRGVNHGGEMVTSELRGAFKRNDQTRAEFLALARGQ